MEKIQTLTEQRDELMRQVGFLNQRKSSLEQTIREKSATVEELKLHVAKHIAMRDYIIETEIPKLKELVNHFKMIIKS